MNDDIMLLLYGFDIGGTKIEFGVFNKGTLDCIATERVPTPTTNYEELLQTIIDLITKYDNQFLYHDQKSQSQQDDEEGSLSLPSIGIGIPGIVDSNTGTLLTANIPSANNQNLQKDLEEKLLSCPGREKCRKVQIENDANCFALSEAYEFLHRSNNNDDEDNGNNGNNNNNSNNSINPSSILGIILGTGVGSGFIIDGKIYSGRHNIAGEFGHTKLPIDAWFYLQNQYQYQNESKIIVDCDEPQPQEPPLFTSGLGQKGCIDNYISGRGFELLYEHYYKERKSAIEIISAYYHDNNNTNANNAVNEHVERFMELLAIILSNLFTILDPHIVVLGGGLSNFDLLYEELPKRIPKHLLPMAKCPIIVKAKHGDSGGGVRGAAFLNL